MLDDDVKLNVHGCRVDILGANCKQHTSPYLCVKHVPSIMNTLQYIISNQ